jgi:hypothetical protein
MILLPRHRHRNDGSLPKGEGETPVMRSRKSQFVKTQFFFAVAAALRRGCSVKYGVNRLVSAILFAMPLVFLQAAWIFI